MDSLTRLLTFLALTNLSVFVLAQNYWCYENGNYTTNSTYHNNLKTLLSSLPSNMGNTGFCNMSLGQNPNRINAIALCRADLQLDKCRSCVKNATAEILTRCPNRKQATKWRHPPCMVRYSNEIILGDREDSRFFAVYNTDNVRSPDQFDADFRILLADLIVRAASGGPSLKVAVGNRLSDYLTIFALLQCTPDLSEHDCTTCLTKSAQKLRECCLHAKGFYSRAPSCYFEYEIQPFYNVTRIQEVQRLTSVPAPPPLPQAASPPGKEDDNTTGSVVVVVVVVPIISALILLGCLGIWLAKRRNKKLHKTLASDSELCSTEAIRYEFNEITEATDNFSDVNKLGKGGFGAVYKGKLQNGQEIAAKRLFWGSKQGDLEFRNEVTLLAKLQHRNLVRLAGFAQEGIERVLIYEFIQNGSLDHFIFDPTKAHHIDWNKRFKIIGDIARGLLYLHEDSRLRVIHRNLKPSNILLDVNMNPKIADFGMARLYEHNESEVNASIVVGTYGYMAPEYVTKGYFSIKSDVFSFGVLILETISGQRNNSFHNENATSHESLLNFAWRNWHEETITNVIDPTLQYTQGCFHEIVRCVHIAFLCIQKNASDRPTMALVTQMLSNFTATLPPPSIPAFFVSQTSGLNSSPLQKRDSRDLNSKNNVSVSELLAR